MLTHKTAPDTGTEASETIGLSAVLAFQGRRIFFPRFVRWALQASRPIYFYFYFGGCEDLGVQFFFANRAFGVAEGGRREQLRSER